MKSILVLIILYLNERIWMGVEIVAQNEQIIGQEWLVIIK